MTNVEIINVFENEILAPRSEHEDRIKELVNEIHKHNFTKSELQKMPKRVLTRMAWTLGVWYQLSTKSEAIEEILEIIK